jgi:hypothetical protein
MSATLEIEFSASLQASNYIADQEIEVDPSCNPRGSGWLFRDRLDLVPENSLCPLIGRGSCNLAGSGEAWDGLREIPFRGRSSPEKE